MTGQPLQEGPPARAVGESRRTSLAITAAILRRFGRLKTSPRDRRPIRAHHRMMLSSVECRAKAAAARSQAAQMTDDSFRAHFEYMVIEWNKVAIMTEWQEGWADEQEIYPGTVAAVPD